MVPETNRPYGPPSDVKTLLSRLRSRNLPSRIDAEYLRDSGLSSGTAPRTIVALKFLKLIDSAGHPTESLRSIHTSTDDEYRGILASVLRDSYADVFAVVDPGEDTQDQVFNVFRKYTPASQRQRMVMFFLGMCREAGIAVSEAAAQGSRHQVVRVPPATARVRALPPRVRQSGRTPPSDLPAALEALVRSLPAPGASLPADQRARWLKMASAALEFLYPEQGDQPEGTTDEAN
jgi:hypothetical protein